MNVITVSRQSSTIAIIILCSVVNARRMRTRVTVLTLCVCPPSANAIKRLYSILNMAIGFLLSVEGFQLTDLSKKASFRSYSHFHFFI